MLTCDICQSKITESKDKNHITIETGKAFFVENVNDMLFGIELDICDECLFEVTNVLTKKMESCNG